MTHLPMARRVGVRVSSGWFQHHPAPLVDVTKYEMLSGRCSGRCGSWSADGDNVSDGYLIKVATT